MINRAELMGRLVQDPRLYYTPNGRPYCRLRIATNRMVNGTAQADFHDVVAWGVTAESCAKGLKKGEIVHVEGRMETQSWEQESQKVERTRVVASRVLFLGQGHKGTAHGSTEAEQATEAEEEAPTDSEPAAV